MKELMYQPGSTKSSAGDGYGRHELMAGRYRATDTTALRSSLHILTKCDTWVGIDHSRALASVAIR